MDKTGHCEVCSGTRLGASVDCSSKYRCPVCGVRYGSAQCFQEHVPRCSSQYRTLGAQRAPTWKRSKGVAVPERDPAARAESFAKRLALLVNNSSSGQTADSVEDQATLEYLRAQVQQQRETIEFIVEPRVSRTKRMERLSGVLASAGEFACFVKSLLEFVQFRSSFDEHGS
jgi:hypothetical protein